jgi:amino acid adenylation domain-containing protein
MDELATRIARLSPERRAVYEALRAQHAAMQRIPRRDSGPQPVAMSFAQQRLWFIGALDRANPAYNCPVPLRLRGPLDADALIQSLQCIAGRHDVLRTGYEMRDGEPVQVIREAIVVPVHHIDLSHLNAGEQEAILQQRVRDDANGPFDLALDPVIRAELIRMADDHHVLMFDIHHIANDHASIRIFFQELAAGYNARVLGGEPALPELPIQYSDYAMWQRERIADRAEGEILWAYWRKTLEGMEALDLPTDRIRPPELSHRGGSRTFDLAPPLVSRLREIGRTEGATLFMTLLAGFYVLLNRHTGKTDIAVGCSATGRDRDELKDLIGFFVNTIVLRTDLEGAHDFRALVRRTRDTVLNGFAHAEFPFDLLVKRLNPHRNSAQTPLVPVMFALDDTPEIPPDLHRLKADIIEPEFITTKFDLLVGTRPRGEGVHGHFQYSSDLFDADTIDRMIGHYVRILEAAAAAPDSALSTMPLLSLTEAQRILVDWNDTGTRFPDDACLHQLFEAHARTDGQRAAIVSGSEITDYGRLNAMADQFAAELRGLGVGPDILVTVLLEPSLASVTAILAVLKAGGAFVPLDSTRNSQQQVEQILHQFRSHILIANAAPPGFEKATPAGLVWIAPWMEAKAPSRARAPLPTDLAYVICTSGSTGTPKAIALEHRGVVNNLTDINRRFGVGPGDRVIFLSSAAFDMSIYETLGMLVAGAALVIPEPKNARSPWRWLECLVEHEITLWNSAPALLELLVEELERKGNIMLPHLRLVLLGGDWVPVTLPDRLSKFAPGAQIICLGGATEASIHSTIYSVEGSHADRASIPYGRPMANQRAFILDSARHAVPIGVPGELYLAGVGLARGYLHQPALTAEKFIILSIGGRLERLFRTGDEARWRPDGVIELLGRLDFQVKVHGQRVDLRAVEHVLRGDPAVRDAIVLPVRDGSKRIVSLAAYVIPCTDRRFSASRLRQHLAQSLPAHMVPAEIVPVERFPTNGSGKIDRLALSKVAQRRPDARPAPTDLLESRLISIWQSVLNVQGIGIDDNLFDLGCDSFKAIRAARSIGDRFPVVEIFKNQTVRTIAAYLRSARHHRASSLHLLTPNNGTLSSSLICIPYGGGNSAAYAPLAKALPEHVALWSVSLPGHDAAENPKPFASVEDAAEACADEIRRRGIQPAIVYGHCAGGAIAVDLARRLESSGHELCAVFIGAALPDLDPDQSLLLQRNGSDTELLDHLQKLGLDLEGAIDEALLADILAVVRHDLTASSRFFAHSMRNPPPKLRTPLYCVFGEQDGATSGFEKNFRAWSLFADSVRCLTIPDAGHYFIKQHAAALAAMLGEATGNREHRSAREPLAAGASHD